jgi:hypothetical protein
MLLLFKLLNTNACLFFGQKIFSNSYLFYIFINTKNKLLFTILLLFEIIRAYVRSVDKSLYDEVVICWVDDGGNMFLRNTCMHSSDYAVLNPRRSQ